MKATDQYFHTLLFTMLYKVVLTFESMDEVLSCANWNQSYWSGFSVVVPFIILYKVVLTDLSVHEILIRSKGRTHPKVHS